MAATTAPTKPEPTPMSSQLEAQLRAELAQRNEECAVLKQKLADLGKIVEASQVNVVPGTKLPYALVRISGAREVAIGDQLFGDELAGFTAGVHYELR